METARALTENLASLLRREHEALAEFLVALAEFDKRRLWVELGHSSLFYFLHRELRLSLGAAQHRKVAAELIQLVPAVVEPLRRGQLCLSSIIEVAKVLTSENWETVLPRFYGLSRREAMEVVAELQPHPSPPMRTILTQVRSGSKSPNDALAPQALSLGDAREPQDVTPIDAAAAGASFEPISPGEMGRPLITPGVPPATFATSTTPAAAAAMSAAPATSATPSISAAGARAVEVVPLTAEQNRLHLTVSKAFMKKLEAAGDAMSHSMPEATPAEILEVGLDQLLAQASKRKGLVEKPQKKPRPMKGEGVPAHVKREVWKRDGGKCQWPTASGGICGSTRRLELDHIQPRSRGGASSVDNLRILCRAHNDLAARRALGEERMDQLTFGLRGAPRRARTG